MRHQGKRARTFYADANAEAMHLEFTLFINEANAFDVSAASLIRTAACFLPRPSTSSWRRT